MNNETQFCPFLGLSDDPQTALAYPSTWNFCHHATPIASPKIDRQRSICLKYSHITCPVFTTTNIGTLPKTIIALDVKPTPKVKTFRLVVVSEVVLINLIYILWPAINNMIGLNRIPGRDSYQESISNLTPSLQGGSRAPNIPSYPNNNELGNLSPTLTKTETRKFTPAPSATRTVTPTHTVTHTLVPSLTEYGTCNLPLGWVLYIVQTGDTLYRLKDLFGTTIRELQLANCMGDSILIKVGQSLYVPARVTATPSPIPQDTPVSTTP